MTCSRVDEYTSNHCILWYPDKFDNTQMVHSHAAQCKHGVHHWVQALGLTTPFSLCYICTYFLLVVVVDLELQEEEETVLEMER